MGRLQALQEAWKKYGSVEVHSDVEKEIPQADFQDFVEVIQKYKKASGVRKERIFDLELIGEDSAAQTALELIVDDATQEDQRTGKVVWITADDKNLENYLNNFLSDMKWM